jgi:three-Cys-motif partner protein
MKRAIDSWRDLCEKYSEPDGLPIWKKAGLWTQDKLYFWKRYLDITTKAMYCNPAFPGGLVYVDLFGGTGVCALKDAPNRRLPGSAIIAAHAAKPFRKIIVCERNRRSAKACRARLAATSAADRCDVLDGDCNELADQVVRKIPSRALTLTFIDPTGLDVQFSTVTKLANNARVDFFVLFADALDISRNCEHVYRADENSKLDQFLGPACNWRKELDTLKNPSGVTRRKLFADIYTQQLERLLGYRHFGEKVMRCDGKPLYRLGYASKDRLGLKFWREALKEDSAGQRALFD